MSILRFGPWASILGNVNPRFQAADRPEDAPYGEPGLVYTNTSPVNCANVDWATTPWIQHVTQYDGDNIPVSYDPIIRYYEDIAGAEYSSEASSLGQAQVTFRFFYQATQDFNMYFHYEINSLLGYGSYYVFSTSVSATDPDNYNPGTDVYYQGVNKSGYETIDCPAGTIGWVEAGVGNFGSDYPGDIVNARMETSAPTP